MDYPDFKKLRTYLVGMGKTAIESFSKSNDNQDVYAFVFDTDEFYGTAIVSINTLSRFETTRGCYDKRRGKMTEVRAVGFGGLKYNSGDFDFIDLAPVPDEFRDWSRNYEDYHYQLEDDDVYDSLVEDFSNAVAAAISTIQLDLMLLKQTHDFVAYHLFHDAPDELIEYTMRKTIDDDSFDRLFPEVRNYQILRGRINCGEYGEAACVWLSFLKAYAFDTPEPHSEKFFEFKSYFEVRPELVAIGSDALPHIFELLDQVMYKRQFNQKDSAEWKAVGPFTKFNSIARQLIWTIKEIDVSDMYVETKLVTYIRSLYELSEKQSGTIGTNLAVTARALSSLLPEKYPEAVIGGNDNRLLNITAFTSRSDIS